MPWFVKRLVLPLLVVAMGVAIYAATQITDGRQVPETPGIARLVPGPGDKVLLQNRVGVVVDPGWDASVVVNGTPIPASQIDEPLNPGEVLYQPSPGKVIEQLLPDQNCVTVQVWRQADGPQGANTRSWCFRAS
jgi:hypothetical protein